MTYVFPTIFQITQNKFANKRLNVTLVKLFTYPVGLDNRPTYQQWHFVCIRRETVPQKDALEAPSSEIESETIRC